MTAISNLIQIKRNASQNQPGSLANGELAWSGSSNSLFIGNFTNGVTKIAGYSQPGVLTANQAIVANNTSGVDRIITSNLISQSITANNVTAPETQIGASTKGYILSVDHGGNTYWKDASSLSVGSQYVQNTDSRVLSGNLIFSGSNTDFYGYVNFTGANVVVTSGVISGNGAYITSVNAKTLQGNTFADIITIANNNGQYAYANAIGQAIVFANQNGQYAFTNAVSNAKNYADNNFVNKNNDNYVATVTSGLGVYDTGSPSGSGTTHTLSIGQDVSPTSNVTFANVATSTLSVTGSSTLGTSSTDSLTLNASVASDIVPTGSHNVGSSANPWNHVYATELDLGASGSAVSITSSAQNINILGSLSVNTTFTANAATIAHNLAVGGDLYVVGNVVSSNVQTISVTDPLLRLGTNNHVSDTLDGGFVMDYYNGSSVVHAGLVRDASDGIFKLITNLTDVPSGAYPINFGAANAATLQAFLTSGALTSNSQTLTITATNSTNVNIIANTLQLSTALNYQYGGTGFNSYNQGDLLVGNTTGGQGLSKLSLGTTGYLLKSDGTNLIYSNSIDGGTY
jgi:hypothetical protein